MTKNIKFIENEKIDGNISKAIEFIENKVSRGMWVAVFVPLGLPYIIKSSSILYPILYIFVALDGIFAMFLFAYIGLAFTKMVRDIIKNYKK